MEERVDEVLETPLEAELEGAAAALDEADMEEDEVAEEDAPVALPVDEPEPDDEELPVAEVAPETALAPLVVELLPPPEELRQLSEKIVSHRCALSAEGRIGGTRTDLESELL